MEERKNVEYLIHSHNDESRDAVNYISCVCFANSNIRDDFLLLLFESKRKMEPVIVSYRSYSKNVLESRWRLRFARVITVDTTEPYLFDDYGGKLPT